MAFSCFVFCSSISKWIVCGKACIGKACIQTFFASAGENFTCTKSGHIAVEVSALAFIIKLQHIGWGNAAAAIVRGERLIIACKNAFQNITFILPDRADQLAVVNESVFRRRRLLKAGLVQRVNAAKGEGARLAMLQIQLINTKPLRFTLTVQQLPKRNAGGGL